MGDVSGEIVGAAVQFLLETLKEQVVAQAHLISDAKNQVDALEKNLRLLKDFLVVDSTKLLAESSVTRSLVRDIREGIYEAEDVIDEFVTHAFESKSKNLLLRVFQSPPKLLSIAHQVKSVGDKIGSLCDDVKEQIRNAQSISIQGGGLEEYDQASIPSQENAVGFEDEAKELIDCLAKETQQLDVICIIGMPGLGKTTLAAKIFRDPTIQDKFSKRIWVRVSDAKHKNVFLAILRGLGTPTDQGLQNKNDEELGKLVADHLHGEDGEEFLVVLDDVWAGVDWRKLQIAFPKSNKFCKVLITSRHEEVARIANPDRPPKNLRTLTQDEGWQLLQLQVFGKRECPIDLQCHGKLIVEQCGGLPLAIVDIGDILAKNSKTKDEWEQVYDSMGTFLNDDLTRSGKKSILSSYNKLPYHLRACFLYLGMFPENHEIPVSELMQMWIAEGFIQQKEDLSLEQTAEIYLKDLIGRSLVRVLKKRPNGKAKTCRIHYLLRHFCKTEAGNERENFLEELKRSSKDGGFHPPITAIEKFRRLCIHSNISNFISLRPSSRRVRSFASFSGAKITLESENVSAIPAAFKLLRVLDARPIKFTKIPKELYQLVHLRYVALTLSLGVLPADFSKLWNIQTLIVDTTSDTFEIKADVLKMIQLRYLKTNVSTTLPKTSSSSKGGEKLQTLGTISPKCCTEEFFDRACNLKKLSIRGQLALLLDGKHESFHFGKLANLKKLKLLNDANSDPASEGKVLRLPQHYQFPPNLRSLTLSATSLKWTDMSILGFLDHLEVLKLKNNAFAGRSWETVNGGFRSLEVLHIESTDLVVWIASGQHFPKIRCLELWNCEKLTEVPIGLADIEALERLQLCNTRSAADSAKKIQEAKQKKQAEAQTTKVSVFKLSFSHDE